MTLIKNFYAFFKNTVKLEKKIVPQSSLQAKESLFCSNYWKNNTQKPLNKNYVSLHSELNGINHFFITGANPKLMDSSFMNLGLTPREMIKLTDSEFKRIKPTEKNTIAYRCIGEKPDFFSEYKLYRKRLNIKKGDVINMREYAYATPEIAYAKRYLTNNKGILYEIEIPKASKVSISGAEIVFPRSSNFECVGIKQTKTADEDFQIIKLRYIQP